MRIYKWEVSKWTQMGSSATRYTKGLEVKTTGKKLRQRLKRLSAQQIFLETGPTCQVIITVALKKGL
jgi:hypothetical protein